MPRKPTSSRKRRNDPDKATYLHHLEQISVHLGAARQLAPSDGHTRHLRAIGKTLVKLYVHAGGNPDAVAPTD